MTGIRVLTRKAKILDDEGWAGEGRKQHSKNYTKFLKKRKINHVPIVHKIKHFYLLVSKVLKISFKFIFINVYNSENNLLSTYYVPDTFVVSGEIVLSTLLNYTVGKDLRNKLV